MGRVDGAFFVIMARKMGGKRGIGEAK